MSGAPENARERWNRKYRERAGFDCRKPRDLVAQAASLIAPGRALDLACGRGRNAIYLAMLGWQVTAVDASEVALDDLKEQAPVIDVVLADLEAGEFQIPPRAFDLIVDTFYLQRDLFAAIREGLRPGGIFAAEIPMQDDAATPMESRYLVKPDELKMEFADWPLERYEEIRSMEHGRKSARLIARKPTR